MRFSFPFIVLLQTVHSRVTLKESEIDLPACQSKGSLNGRRLREVASPRTGWNIFFSVSLCLPPSDISLAASTAANDAVFAMAFGVKAPRSSSEWEASERFVVIADLNASLKVPPTRYFGQVRVCAVSRCHEQTIHRLLKKRETYRDFIGRVNIIYSEERDFFSKQYGWWVGLGTLAQALQGS